MTSIRKEKKRIKRELKLTNDDIRERGEARASIDGLFALDSLRAWRNTQQELLKLLNAIRKNGRCHQERKEKPAR